MKDAGIMLRLVHESMIKLGIDTNAVYQKCGVQASHLQGTKTRLKHEANKIFWRVLEEVADDKYIGLKIAKNIPLFRGQVLEYLFLSSQNFGDGLNRVLKFQRLLTDVAESYLIEGEKETSLILDSKMGDRLNHQYLECTTMGVIHFFKSLTDNTIDVLSVNFSFPKPENYQEYLDVFGCNVTFSNEKNAIVFSSDVLTYESNHAEPDLLALHEAAAANQIASLEKQDLVRDIEKVIAELLESQNVCLESISKRMGLTPRSLRSSLTLANTSFNKILSEYRSLLAKRLLATTNESIEEIVYLTGFSEPSTFYRAFKRWTGETPVEYRRSRKGSRDGKKVAK